MLSASLLGFAALAVSLCNANPIVVVSPPVYAERSSSSNLALREAMNMAARDASLQKRSEMSVNLDHGLDEVTLIKGSWSETVDGINNTVSVKLECIECSTTGTVSAKIKGSILKPKLRLDFSGVAAFIDLGVKVADKATYTYTIFSSESPVGISLHDVSLGLVFYVDLVLSLSAEVELEGGFFVQVGNDSYLEADIRKGTIVDSLFTDTTVTAIPITVSSGDATFKADLRLRVEAGASVDILGAGLDAELGIYANILEFIVEAQNTPACDVMLSETWDINAGAFLDADVVINYSSFGAVPTISTTLYQGPTATQCIRTTSSATTITTASASASASSKSHVHTNATATATAAVVDAVRLVVGAHANSANSFSANVNASGSSIAFPPVTASMLSGVAFPSVTASSPASSAVSVGGLKPLFANTTASVAAYSGSMAAAAAATTVALGSNGTTLTSTIFATSTYTITSCAASVVNCPASLQNKIIITDVVTKTVAICPEASTTIMLSSSKSVPVAKTTTASASTSTVTAVTAVYVLVPLETPIVATFTAPTSVASVSISVIGAVTEKETATVVPVLATGGANYGNGSNEKAVLAVGDVGPTAFVLPTGSAAVFASAASSAAVSIATSNYVAFAETASLGVTASAKPASTASPTTTSAQSAVTAVVTAAAGRVMSGSFAAVVGAMFGALLLL
ncbi:hypothetical protein CMQ_3343 [Grosmannia clavigera kw1407]|uniref:Uncharacterized protein n=1 Tax=Grosmannia clavigera (strain kw1407 / UAMH 11150) TaxID=655863 RepID=F0XAL7_GROCL|nr:uncharacterized protein CMQ_3343 [Grosmannia clavigera kw1407]EFX05274.1 hypothetical protein CMQ_3343 [Grosmannia clavigera kw1407]